MARRGEAVQLGVDHAVREERAGRMGRQRREVQRPHDLVLQPALDVHHAVRRHVRAEAGDAVARVIAHRAEQLEGEPQHERVGRAVERVDGGEAVRSSGREGYVGEVLIRMMSECDVIL